MSASEISPAASSSHSQSQIQHKTLFVLLDGLGDVTLKQHASAHEPQGQTPMQYAHLPTLDMLAQNSLCGLVDSVEAGQACGSDTAHLSLLGYDPLLFYRGRGAFESMGAGLEMEVGDVAFKSNFAWMQPPITNGVGVVRKRRADRSFHEWGIPLCDALNGIRLPHFPEIQVSVKYATEHRCGVRLRGPDLTDCISGTDPLVDGRMLRVCTATQPTAAAARTAAIVNELSLEFHRVLSSHPINIERARRGLPIANVILLRGAGARIHVKPFAELHGFAPGRSLMVAPTAIIAGLGQSIGMEHLPIKEGTGDYRTNLMAKARGILDRMSDDRSDYNFGFLHVKAIDDAGHDRSPGRKIQFLQRADQMIAFIVQELQKQQQQQNTVWSIVVTGDHSTPVLYGDHSYEPVPFLHSLVPFLPPFSGATPALSSSLNTWLQRPHIRELRELFLPTSSLQRARTFDELECAKGSLGRFPGREVMPLIVKLRNIALSSTPSIPRSPAQIAPLSLLTSCKPGVSPWQEEFASVLPSFSPSSDILFPASAEVIIIGAGLSGLCTALALARLGYAPVVLERGLIGDGATGRNGGHMHPIDEEERKNMRKLFADLEEEGVSIDSIDYRARGGYSLKHHTELSSSASSTSDLSSSEVDSLLQSSYFASALHRPSGGSIHPMKLLVALARIVTSSKYRVQIWQQTPVTSVVRNLHSPSGSPGWLVQTRRGTVATKVVVHATNAWVAQLLPSLKDRVLPVRNHVIQTTPIHSAESSSSVAGTPLWDGLSLGFHQGFDYQIQRSDHRVVLGGMRYLAPNMDVGVSEQSAPMLPYVVDKLRLTLPTVYSSVLEKSPSSISHLWTGILGFTASGDPFVGGVSDESRGQFVLAGFSGHGMPRCNAAADRIAVMVRSYLQRGVFESIQLPVIAGSVGTIPNDELLRTIGISRDELARLHSTPSEPSSKHWQQRNKL